MSKEPGLIARLLRRAARGATVETATLTAAATVLEQSEISLADLESAFPFVFRRLSASALVLQRPGDPSFFPAAETLQIVPAFIKAWLRERNLTAQFSTDLCSRFVDYLLADAALLGAGERVTTNEALQRELEAKDLTGLLRNQREAASQQHHRTRA